MGGIIHSMAEDTLNERLEAALRQWGCVSWTALPEGGIYPRFHEMLRAQGLKVVLVGASPNPEPIVYPPLDSDERRLWIDTYVAAVRHGTTGRSFRAFADESVREYRSSVKR